MFSATTLELKSRLYVSSFACSANRAPQEVSEEVMPPTTPHPSQRLPLLGGGGFGVGGLGVAGGGLIKRRSELFGLLG